MEIGNIQSVDIDNQMRTAYLDYAMSVIVARALPDARDGLKPVQRRILFSMYDMGIRANSSYKKSARIVGEVMGKYHPHGDLAVYDAMARMAQDFSLRYLLVDGQGNFGSVDGDPPAAMRYTEARLNSLSEEMLRDIDADTVDFGDNFDGSLQEPLVLPSRLPNLLLNGSSGIAVGMATNCPPHNLRELCLAIDYLIEHYDTMDEITNDELMRFVPGPDFPTGGIIVGRESIHQAFSTGRGRLTVRGVAHIEEMKNGRNSIIITEIPYQVNKTNLIERIADLAREGKIDDISDMRDESDRNGMGIVIELKRGAQARSVLNKLYKYTPLQSTFGVNMLALINGEPRLLTLKRAIQLYIEHRQQVLTRRSQFELDKARAREHILSGLLIALNNLDAVIQTIRQADDVEQAKLHLVERFSLSEIQAQAILDMQLRRLAALERHKIEEEQVQILERIAYLIDLLASPRKILALIQDDLKELSEKYGDERRTKIIAEAAEDLKDEDLIRDEPILITLTQKGYIKKTPASLFRVQGRGRHGKSGQTMREEDSVLMLLSGRSLQTILFFSDRGKVYAEKAYQIPDAGRTDKGIPIVNVLNLEAYEKITAAVAVPDFNGVQFCTMATVKGRVKRVTLDEFSSVRPSGLIAMGLEEGDQLGWVRLTRGKDDILIVTENGQALRMKEQEIRPMGRPASGVNGINLRKGDRVASMEVVEPGGYLMIVTTLGFGKRSPLDEYPTKGRATGGVTTIDQKNMDKIGTIVAARVVQDEDEVTLISSGGTVLRLKVKEINPLGRATRGVHMMDLGKGDSVASIARLLYDALKAEEDAAYLLASNGDGGLIPENGNGSAPENGDGTAPENGDGDLPLADL
jgi:DNA gyrase subunit A